MAYDTGFSRRSSSEREIQPVAIVSVDPTSRVAFGATRTRHSVRINCAYATGDTITVPAVGEQWYVERFDMEWRLYGRIPFNDATLNIEPEEGQVSVGSASGPLELNGPEVRVNGKVFRLNGVYYRDSGSALERSEDMQTWEAVGAGGEADLMRQVAAALTGYAGAGAGAGAALSDWSALVQAVLDNFGAFWTAVCDNTFVTGLKRMGLGDTDVARIVDGLQNFLNYLFGVVFCDFSGDLTPQTALARLRDLLAPLASNPFVLGLRGVAEALQVATGDLLNDAVAGATAFLELVFDIVTCNIDALTAKAAAILQIIGQVGEQFGPANVVKWLSETFGFLADPNNPVGAFANGVRDFLTSFFPDLLDAGQSLLKDVLTGLVKLVSTVYDVLTCQFDATELAALVSGVTASGIDPLGILAKLSELLGVPGGTGGLLNNPVVVAIQGLAQLIGSSATGLLDQLVNVTGDLLNWLLKIAKTILPVDGLWETLLPFFDWTAVDAVALPDLLSLLGDLNPLLILLKPLEDFLGWASGGLVNFITNLHTFLDGLGLLDGTFDPAVAVDYFLKNTLGLLDETGKIISTFIGDAVSGITTLVANLLSLFGIDFTPTDANGDPVAFNAATALTTFVNKLLVDGLGGVFGATVAEVTRFFTRIRNLFGLNLSAFTGTDTFDFAAAATGFINAVLVNAPSAAVSVLQGVLDTVTSLAYKVADAVIQAIRGIPFVGSGIADFLKTLLNNFTDFTRGSVKSGTNLLADAGAEKSGFWTQAGTAWASSPKHSGGGSVMVSGGNVVWMNVNDLGEVSPIRTQPNEYMHMEAYVYSYYSATVYLYAKTENSLDGTSYTYYLGSAGANTTWSKVQADVQIPSPWDRVSFGVYAANYPVYVDDMLVREITAAQAASGRVSTLNYALYQTTADPAAGTRINIGAVPTTIPPSYVTSPSGSGTIATDIGSVYNTLTGNTSGTGNGGLVATVGNASSGLVQKTNSIITNTFNAWYGSGSTGTATEMGTVIGSIKTTVSNTWTVMVLPYGTTTWYRTSNGASNGTPYSVDKFLEFWVICVGSGAGGGKGQVGYPGQANPGGNGGLGGKWFAKQLNPANLPSSANLIIGAGGAGKTSGTVDAPDNRNNTQFGYGYQPSFYVSTAEIQTASVASIISYYAATDSQPGNGGTGATGNGSGVQAGFGESTPLATGGLGGISAGGGGGVGSIGGSGGDANNTGQQRAGGGGGGGGGAGTYQNGGNGGSGGVPGGGGGGGGGAWASGGPVGGNGGTGGHGCIILLYRLAA